MPATVAHNHNPRLVLMNGEATGFAVYEGRKRLGEYVAPIGIANAQDVEDMRVHSFPPHQPASQGKDAA